MSIVSNFTFNNMSRIGDDKCDLSQRNVQNTKGSNYLLTSYYANECGMQKPIEFATSQPNVNFSGSHQMGLGGCNVDDNTVLRDGDGLSQSKCRLTLNERPFLTVPYLGRGSSNPVLEAHLQQGDVTINKKSVYPSSEKSYIQHQMYPLMPSIKATVTNPANLIEGVAADGWIRGGVPSRELTRDKDYFTQQHNNNY
jgi:hypothetical protein